MTYSTVCLAVLTLVRASTSAALAGDDMLIYSDQRNNGWGDWGWVPHYATNSQVHSGTNAMVFAASGAWQAWWLKHDDIDTSLYTNLTLWVNGGAVGGQYVGIQAELGGSTAGLPRVAATAPTNTWAPLTFSLATLGIANKTNLTGLQIWNSGTLQSNFFIDDITLVAAPKPAAVHVGVQAAQTIRTVDARVFGINQAAWDGNIDTSTTMGILNDLGNPCLRWPGGSWGDDYHWTNEYRGWGSYSYNFMHVATNTHAQAFIIVNYGSSTPEEAAFGVRLFNVTNRCGFKYWEVGNEVGGGWETDNNTNAPWQPHDPWTYAMRFTNYYAQMKAVDPSIKIGAVADITEDGTSNYTNHPVVNPRTGVTHNGWTPVMLTYLRSNNVTPDFLIEHKYAPTDGDTWDLLYSKTWAGDAAALRQMLTDYLGSAGTNVTLECTENGGGGDRQRVSLVGGLFYADSVGQVLQTEFNSRIWWNTRNGPSGLSGSDPAFYGWRTNSSGAYIYDEGIVYDLGAATNRYPAYYAAKLLPYFAGGGDTVVSATNDYPLLGTYAVKRTNGALTLLVINKSSCSNLNASISIGGFTPTNAVICSYGIPQDNAARDGIGSPDLTQTNFSGAAASFSCNFAPFSASVLVLNPNPAPPLITNQPLGKILPVGSNAVFTAGATGPGPVGYQWQLNGINLANGGRVSGAQTSTLTINNLLVPDAGTYSVLVTNSAWAINSQAATLVVTKGTPVVTWTNPAAIAYGTALTGTQLNASASIGGSFLYSPGPGTVLRAGVNTLTVVFTPGDPVNYSPVTNSVTESVSPAPLTVTSYSTNRLYGTTNPIIKGVISGIRNGDNITANYSSAATPASPVGGYPITFTLNDPNGRVPNYLITTNNGTLTVNPAPAPTITGISPAAGPTNGGTSIFILGTGFENGATVWLGGRTATPVVVSNSTLLSALTPPAATGLVNVVITNADGNSVTRTNGFTYGVAPGITPLPGKLIFGTEGFALCMNASGTPPLNYQWQFNATNLLNATASTHVVSPGTPANAGNYAVVVTNAFGTVTSGASAAAFFGNLQYAAGNSAQITLAGNVGAPYEVDYADELLGTNHWSVLTNLTLPSSPFLLSDPASSRQSHRFYRAVALP